MRSPTENLNDEIQACRRCPYAEEACNIVNGKMLGFGHAGEYMIVGMNPSSRRTRIGGYAMAPPRPLNNTSEGYLWRVLKQVHWPIRDTYWTNLVKCSTDGNADLNLLHAWTCINAHFEREFKAVNPRYIVCLGNWVFELVKGAMFLPPSNVFKVFHHAYIARTPTKYEDWRKQWERIIAVGK